MQGCCFAPVKMNQPPGPENFGQVPIGTPVLWPSSGPVAYIP
jgi:hypothetical protein